MMEGDLTGADEHIIQYTYDVLQNCMHETYNLLTNVTQYIVRSHAIIIY